VPLGAAAFDIRIRQTPRVRVETALPKFFGIIDPATVQHSRRALPKASKVLPTLDSALAALGVTQRTALRTKESAIAAQLGFTAEIENLISGQAHARLEAHTGFIVRGARSVSAEAKGWLIEGPFPDPEFQYTWHLRAAPEIGEASTSLALTFESDVGTTTGILVAALAEFICKVVVDNLGRVTSVNYVPSVNSSRYALYQVRADEIERMKAFGTVAGRHGLFIEENQRETIYAEFFRPDGYIDPTLSLYAAYTYAQAGHYAKVDSIYRFMRGTEPELPVPFDVVLLATRNRDNRGAAEHSRYAPFTPTLSQGWALLAQDDSMFTPIHAQLRSHLIPALWTTFNEVGAKAASAFAREGGLL
jgi:hypothetical protein